MMKIGKRGNLSLGSIEGYIILFVLMIVLFQIIASLYPVGVTAGNALNASGAPLGSFFASGGVVWLVIFAGLVIFIVISALKGMRRTK